MSETLNGEVIASEEISDARIEKLEERITGLERTLAQKQAEIQELKEAVAVSRDAWRYQALVVQQLQRQ